MLLRQHPHFWYKTAKDCGFVPDILYLNFWFLVSRCVTAWLTVVYLSSTPRKRCASGTEPNVSRLYLSSTQETVRFWYRTKCFTILCGSGTQRNVSRFVPEYLLFVVQNEMFHDSRFEGERVRLCNHGTVFLLVYLHCKRDQ
jgi:hypothetical protein